jgi:hypothetical protein
LTKRIFANRRNSNESGPRNTTSSRYNATRHGLLAAGITEIDDAEGYRNTLRDLEKEMQPVGVVEMFLVKTVALEIIRLQRARRLEGEYVTSVLNPPIHEATPFAGLSSFDEGALVDPEIVHHDDVQVLVSTFQRYESAITLRLFRALHELERLQRTRQGEKLPAPTAIDVTIDVDRHVTAGPSADQVFEGSLSPHHEKGGEAKSGTPVKENDSTEPPEES